MGFGKYSTLKQILDHEMARAILLRHVPGADKHPDLTSALYMSLDEAASYPEANIGRETLAALVKDLEVIQD